MDELRERQDRMADFIEQRTKDLTVIRLHGKLALRYRVRRAGVVASLVEYLKSSAYRDYLQLMVEQTDHGEEIYLEIDLHHPFHIPTLARSLMGVLQLSYTLT